MPAETASLWALYDKLWPLVLAGIWWLFKRQEKQREETDENFRERANVISVHESRMAVIERRLDDQQERANEDRQMIRKEFQQVHAEMALMRKDFGQGFKDMGDRIMNLLRSDQ